MADFVISKLFRPALSTQHLALIFLPSYREAFDFFCRDFLRAPGSICS
jgi:hypothetical protein